jgi:hypothetical protein
MQVGGNPIPETVLVGTPNFQTITPSDVTPYNSIRSIYCVTAGTLVAENSVGAAVSIAMTAGQTIPISPAKVKAATTGTYIALT